MKRALLLDLGGVVVTFDRRRTADAIATAACGVDVTELARGRVAADWERVINGAEGMRLLHAFEEGRIMAHEFSRSIDAMVPYRFPPHAFWEAWVSIFTPIPGVVKQVEALQASGVRVIAVTDTDPLRLAQIVKLTGLRFDGLTASFLIGARKPSRVMYEHALRQAGCAKEECLYVDDVKENVEAASALGIPSVHAEDATAPAFTSDGLLREFYAPGVTG